MSARDGDILRYKRAKQYTDQVIATLSKSVNGCKEVAEDKQLI
jgi:hypothetical protein